MNCKGDSNEHLKPSKTEQLKPFNCIQLAPHTHTHLAVSVSGRQLEHRAQFSYYNRILDQESKCYKLVLGRHRAISSVMNRNLT